MRFSQKTNYALRAMLALAMERDDQPLSIASIGKRQQIPEQFLQVIMRELRQGGFVTSKRGKTGGYVLGRQASHITIADLVSYLEGGFFTPAQDQCPPSFQSLWGRVVENIDAVLKNTTLADLAADERQYTVGFADYVI